jgi:hypothetical protein
MTFMRSFTRDVQLRENIVAIAQGCPENSGDTLSLVSRMLLATDSDDRGTVASMAREIDEASDGRTLHLIWCQVNVLIHC